jgi:hypothetical protein
MSGTGLSEALLGNGHHPLGHVTDGWLAHGYEVVEGPNCGEASVAGSGPVSALLFEVVEEVRDERGVDVLHM